jgi:hypothetical protein
VPTPIKVAAAGGVLVGAVGYAIYTYLFQPAPSSSIPSSPAPNNEIVAEQHATTNFPSFLCCPITLMPMTDPVICSDGWTYERSAILGWLEGTGAGTSPMTREDCKIVARNRALLEAIAEWNSRQEGGA